MKNFLVAGLVGLTAVCANAADQPTKKEFVPSFLKAGMLNREAQQHYDKGQYASAARTWQQVLETLEQIYPKSKYPQGNVFLGACMNNLGMALQGQGNYGKALHYAERALAMTEQLYPKERYAQGHADLATSLNNLGFMLVAQGKYVRGLDYYQRALAMHERLYPRSKYPQGHYTLSVGLNNIGTVLRYQGEFARAQEYFQLGLAMDERLYPKEKYPDGHLDLAASLNNLGSLLLAQGEHARALVYFRKSLDMKERLYSEAKYPSGHPLLALTLNNLGAVFQAHGDLAMALVYFKKALVMDERLFPKKKYPQGHRNLAIDLNNIATVLRAQGEIAQALEHVRQCLAIREGLYPKDKYPLGHPELAGDLNNLGMMLRDRGEYDRALDYLRRGLEMKERCYPKEDYPMGHPELALSLQNMGATEDAAEVPGRGLASFQKALAMRQRLTELFVDAASEAEAFSLAASLPKTRDGFLSAARHVPKTDAIAYGQVWRGKAAISRVLERRQHALEQVLASGTLTAEARREAQKLWDRFVDTRRALSRLMLTPPRDVKAHRQALQQLGEEKVDLEKKLASLLPDFARRQQLDRQGHDVLLQKLPADAVFIDILRYVRFDQNPKRPGKDGERQTECYVAFVLRKDQPVQRVELDHAKPIDDALEAWRTEIQQKKMAGRGSSAAQELRRLIWEPLAKHVPSGTKTIWVAPDGALSRLPWVALPVNKEDRVLLEDCSVALVPHGPFLLERLSDSSPKDANDGVLVAVGMVQYGARPQAAQGGDLVAFNRTAVWGDRKVTWNELPATGKEVAQIVSLAPKGTVHRLTGAEATTTRLLAELPEARWVHLATHGFFADKKFRSILQVDEMLFDRRAFREGPPPGARNPLVLSGLVLAGANLPLPEDMKERTTSDGGILTAEAIAGLPLQKLELTVLSACETGLGEVAGGEGVFGLQRAFHMAGAKNVVASLWKVDDEATAALMALFYDKLWRQKKPAIVALREAQLTLYHHPERMGVLAKDRGPNFDKVARLPVTPVRNKKPEQDSKPATKLWAGFVLSGLGR
jgi:CHAT domain-containing protein/Tfp pilus assembly protein PilF